MDRTDLVRLRWRLSGAWLWPILLVLSFVDAAVVHWLPPQGDSEGAVGAWLVSTALMLAAVVFTGPLIGFGLRRVRRDLPRAVARNYAGTIGVLGVSLALAISGVVHHSSITADRAALLEARERAVAWIGDHAPAQFMVHARDLSALGIQPPDIYRLCAPNNSADSRWWCVVVDVTKPFGSGVHYAGAESNALLDQGAN